MAKKDSRSKDFWKTVKEDFDQYWQQPQYPDTPFPQKMKRNVTFTVRPDKELPLVDVVAKKDIHPGLYRTKPAGYNFGMSGDDILKYGYKFIYDKDHNDLILVDEDNKKIILRVPNKGETLDFIEEHDLWAKKPGLENARWRQSLGNKESMDRVESQIKEGGDLAAAILGGASTAMFPGAALSIFSNPVVQGAFVAPSAVKYATNPTSENAKDLVFDAGLTFLPFGRILQGTNTIRTTNKAIKILDNLSEKSTFDSSDLEDFYSLLNSNSGRKVLRAFPDESNKIINALENSDDGQLARDVFDYVMNNSAYTAKQEAKITEALNRINSGNGTLQDVQLLSNFERDGRPVIQDVDPKKIARINKKVPYDIEIKYSNGNEYISNNSDILEQNGKLFVKDNRGNKIQVEYDPSGNLIVSKNQNLGEFDSELLVDPRTHTITNSTNGVYTVEPIVQKLSWWSRPFTSDKGNTFFDKLKNFRKPKETTSLTYTPTAKPIVDKYEFSIGFENLPSAPERTFDFLKTGLSTGVITGVPYTIFGHRSLPAYQKVGKGVKDYYFSPDSTNVTQSPQPENMYNFNGDNFHLIKKGNNYYAIVENDSIAYPAEVVQSGDKLKISNIDFSKNKSIPVKKIGKNNFGFLSPTIQTVIDSTVDTLKNQNLPVMKQPERVDTTRVRQQREQQNENNAAEELRNAMGYIPEIFRNVNYV